MNKLLTIALFLIFTTPIISQQLDQSQNYKAPKMKITVGSKEFTATLNDSEAAKEFALMLPMTLRMGEHSGNEKYFNLPKDIAGISTNPKRVQAGELMIWASNTLVLFYGEGTTAYSYIKLGQIDNISGLSQSLGKGSVKVKFELRTEEKKRLIN